MNHTEHESITKISILSRLGCNYDPLSLMSSTLAEDKRICRDVCDEKNAEIGSWSPEKVSVFKVDETAKKRQGATKHKQKYQKNECISLTYL